MPKVGDVINAENASWSFASKDPNTLKNHMKKSIPQYDKGHSFIVEISEFFVKQESVIYDIGCSNGELTKRLALKHCDKNALVIGIDSEKNFIDSATSNYADIKNLVYKKENATEHKYKNCDLVILYYTLHFIEISKRRTLLKNIYDSLKEGGALLLFEKSRQRDTRINDVLNQLYIDFKLKNGYSGNEIVAKARSLKGILEPLSLDQNLQILEAAGFKDPCIVYKELCFDGILAVK